MGTTVDSLDIQISASAQKASDAIDVLVGKIGSISTSLNKIDTTKLSNVFKNLSDSISGSVFKGFGDFAKNVESQTKRISKTLEQIEKQYEGLGKGFQLKGSTEYIQKQIDSLTNKLENAKLKKEDFEKSGKTNLGGYETAVKNVIKYTNQIESLKNQLDSMKNMQEIGGIRFQGIEEAARKLSDFQSILNTSINDIKTLESVYGGLSNLPKGTLDNQIEKIRISVDELKRSFPEATGMISAFEKEMQKLQDVSKGLTKETAKVNVDTNSIEQAREKMEEIKQRFAGKDINWKFTGNFDQIKSTLDELEFRLAKRKQQEQEMISAGKIDVSGFEKLQSSMATITEQIKNLETLRDRTEEFNQSLSKLQVPPIHEENLTKLQNALRKTEEETEKLRVKLANGINMGRIIPNVDDSGFRKLTEQIALSEKQAEALKEKIKELGGDTSESGSRFEKFKYILSNFSNQSSRTSSASNLLSKNIKNLSSAMNGFSASAGKAMSGMKSFARQALSAMGIYLGVYGAIRGMKSALSISSQLTEVQNVVDVTFGDMAYKVEEFAKTSIEQFGMSELSLKQYSSRFQAMGQAMKISTSSIGDANAFLERQTKGYVKASDSMADMSLNLTKLTADMASFYDVEQKVMAQKLASGIMAGQARPLRDYGLDLTQATVAEWAMKNGLDANMQSMTQAEKTMLRYQYVMANTTAAQGDFARTANTWANQIRILKQNFQQLAGIIGGVLVNAFKPVVKAINTAMGSIISFAKTISNALGQIFGWTYEEGGGGITQDFEGAEDASEGIADSTGTASDNIKKMQAGLRAFDELKTISMPDMNDGTGGGSTGGVVGAGGGVAEGGDWVKGDSILKRFESEIDSIYELGEYIGNTLTKAMNGIDWDSIYEGARNFGSGLASFLNGLISPELFSALGKTIAGALNTALNFLDSFGETFDFTNFGNSLSAGLVSFLTGIDWATALSAASNWGIGIGNALNAFITPETFGAVGTAIGNALNTAVQFVLDLGATLNFEQFGLSIATGINNFFETFDFIGLAESINVWIKGALTTATTLLQETDFEQIGNKIGEFLKELDFLGIAGDLAEAIWEAIKAAFELLGGLFSEAPLETALITAFAVLKFTGVGKLIAGNIATSLSTSLATALSGLTLPSLPILAAIAGVGAALIDLWNTSESFRDTVTDSFEKVKNSLTDAFNKVKDAVTPLWDKVKELGQAFYDFYESSGIKKVVEILASLKIKFDAIVASAVITVLGNMISGFATIVGGVIDTLTGLLNILTGIFTLDTEKIAEGFSKILDGVGEAFSGFLQQFGIDTEKIGDFFSKIDIKKITKPFSDAWSNIKKIWNNAKSWFNTTVITPISNIFTELKTNVQNAFTNAWNLAKGVWEKVSGWFTTNIFTPVTTTFSNVKTNIHNAFTNAWNLARNVWSKVSGWFNDHIKTPITNTFNTVKNNVHNAFSNAWSLARGVWNKVSGWFTDHIKTPVTNTFNSLRDGIKNAFTNAYNGIKNTFSSIGDFFKGIANNIISPIGKAVNGIINGINWVLGKVGSKTKIELWNVPQFSKGANGLPQDTIGIVNDQKGNTYKELIVPPHGNPFIPEGRNVMLPMEKGTKIMPAKQTKEFMQKINGMPHFAGGIGDFFSGAWAKISEFTGNIWDYISNPGKILQIAMDKFTDLSGMLEPVLSIAKGAANTLLSGATDFIKKIFDEELTVNYNPSAGVEQWRGLATKALQITNQFTASNLNALLNQMQHESSGNPRAINLWDANAKKGTPSKGLMQVIDPTFRAYALSPHNKDIYDPLSNMIASIRYTLARYGSLYAGWTARGYKGYAGGIGKINFADLIPQYRVGGFPEDGLFYANHNELVGRFSNGQTAVANNEQITNGIAEAIYPAVYNAVSAAMRNNSGNGNVTFQVEGDPNGIFKVVQKEWKNEARRLQKNPVPIYVD